MDDLDEIVCRIRIERPWILLGIDQMGPNVVLDHFSHQTGDASAYAGDQVHDAFAFGFLSECTLDRFDLPLDATDAGKELFLFSNGMAHCGNIAYPPILRNSTCHILPGRIYTTHGR